MKKLILALTVAIAMCGTAFAQTTTEAQITWASPTEGPAVASYNMEVEMNGAVVDTITNISGTMYVLPLVYGDEYRVRVIAVGLDGKLSVPSEWSDPWVDFGPPGQPGKPVISAE